MRDVKRRTGKWPFATIRIKWLHMGEEYQKGAKEKFQKVQEAYENIKKSRGMT